jgi:hypothetical protein
MLKDNVFILFAAFAMYFFTIGFFVISIDSIFWPVATAGWICNFVLYYLTKKKEYENIPHCIQN